MSFFFSSRRRHTRCGRDWSSDVCSSDLRTNTIVTPPVPFSLDGFVSQPGKLMLNVLVDDVTLSQYPVKLQLHIEGNGIKIGRASCRERVEISVVAVLLKKK